VNSETNTTKYASMREDEVGALRREVARLRTRIADLESQIERNERKEQRRLRSVS